EWWVSKVARIVARHRKDDQPSAPAHFAGPMREERSPVLVRQPRVCRSSTGVPAECDLHLVWNGRGYATQPLHRPGAPSQRYAFGRENLLVEGPADCQREGGGVVAEVAVRVDCEELEEAREVALRQIGVDYGD